MIDLERINSWSETEACEAFLHCCGAERWAKRMVERRPFATEANLFTAAAEAWRGLEPSDWLQAFAAHPQIGDMDSLRRRFGPSIAWSAAEQSRVVGAPDHVLRALTEGNARYETRFGHRFIVCATGKTAAEMLALLEQRLDSDPARELRIAAGEQEKITRIRLEKLTS
jgi:2-oxo-4-hydroxy-4-carboxy-5-ureidoimidazoline decarboxylase